MMKVKAVGDMLAALALSLMVLSLAACAAPEKRTAIVSPPSVAPEAGGEVVSRGQEIADLKRITQELAPLAEAAGEGLVLDEECRTFFREEFRRNFFLPWTSDGYLTGPEQMRSFMRQQARGRWFLVNKRRIRTGQMRDLLENCDLEKFPSRNEPGIAVAPGHLRGLPTPMPFFERADSMPFDMLSYPQVKLNEPLKVLHASRDGVWLFVETAYSNGWIEARDVAFLAREEAREWMEGPHVAVTKDSAAIADGRGSAAFPAKIGTILPLAGQGEEWWEVKVASAGEGGKAGFRPVRIPREVAAPFPLEFDKGNVVLIGDQLLGHPYGWGEQHGLRDCSALLRDFFLPFGIWLPRTSTDQIESVPASQLDGLPAQEKEALILEKGVPFKTLLFKPGHIMLYVGKDAEGRPLLFHDAWSVKVKEGEAEKTHMIGFSVITGPEPGKELGLVPGTSLIEKATRMGILTERCGGGATPFSPGGLPHPHPDPPLEGEGDRPNPRRWSADGMHSHAGAWER